MSAHVPPLRPLRSCLARVYWYDTEHATTCRLPAGHASWHHDGLRFFDDHGIQQPTLGQRRCRGVTAG